MSVSVPTGELQAPAPAVRLGLEEKNKQTGASPSTSLGRRAFLGAIVGTAATTLHPLPWTGSAGWAAAAEEDRLLARLRKGLAGLDYLLAHWEEETTECIYADVPRELLETKNKEALLKAATKFALYDKSDSTVSCKRTAKPVRQYLGLVSADTPLYRVDFLLQKAASRVDPERLDEYIAATEEWSELISAADSGAYMSSRDYSSFAVATQGESDARTFLGQARRDAARAREVLARLIEVLE